VYGTVRSLGDGGLVERRESRPLKVLAIDPRAAFGDSQNSVDEHSVSLKRGIPSRRRGHRSCPQGVIVATAPSRRCSLCVFVVVHQRGDDEPLDSTPKETTGCRLRDIQLSGDLAECRVPWFFEIP